MTQPDLVPLPDPDAPGDPLPLPPDPLNSTPAKDSGYLTRVERWAKRNGAPERVQEFRVQRKSQPREPDVAP